jgi:hypothetical protein
MGIVLTWVSECCQKARGYNLSSFYVNYKFWILNTIFFIHCHLDGYKTFCLAVIINNKVNRQVARQRNVY